MESFILTVAGGLSLLLCGTWACRRWGFYALPGAVLVLAAIVAVYLTDHYALTTLTGALIIGCVSGFMIRYGRSIQFLLLVSSCALAFTGTGHYYYLLHFKKVDIVTENNVQMKQVVANLKIPDADKAYWNGLIDDSTDMNRKTIPFRYLFQGVMWTVIGFFVIRFAFRKKPFLFAGIDRFRLNDYFIVPLIASIGVFAVTMKRQNTVHEIAFNAILMIGFFYMIQGMGIVKHFLITKRFPTMLLPALVVLVFIVGQEIAFAMMICFAGFGALDLWADFRGFTKKSVPGGDDVD